MAETDSPPETYVVDSSSWIAIEGHPNQNRLRSAIVGLIEAGRIKLPPEVWTEIGDTSSVTSWLEPYRKQIVENRRTDVSYMQLVGQVTHQFPAMAGVNAGRRNKADPWVVGLAAHSQARGESWAVVCNETLSNRPNRKMPTACAQFNAPCYSLVEMLRREFPDDDW
jgi:hypothetical protein